MSQLGMMVIAVGLSSYNIALFHLINHAFYKGLLFLGAGAVIHAVADNQDFRKYGGLIQYLPLSYSVMLIASLSLVAIPFMTGLYSTKVLYLTFLSEPNGSLINYRLGASAHEGNLFMNIPLITLAILSIFFGFNAKEIFVGIGS